MAKFQVILQVAVEIEIEDAVFESELPPLREGWPKVWGKVPSKGKFVECVARDLLQGRVVDRAKVVRPADFDAVYDGDPDRVQDTVWEETTDGDKHVHTWVRP